MIEKTRDFNFIEKNQTYFFLFKLQKSNTIRQQFDIILCSFLGGTLPSQRVADLHVLSITRLLLLHHIVFLLAVVWFNLLMKLLILSHFIILLLILLLVLLLLRAPFAHLLSSRRILSLKESSYMR